MADYLTVVDLFCGPGGLSRGFEDARNHNFRFKTVVANDIDDQARQTFQKNHEDAEFILGSISDEQIKKKIQDAVKKATGKSTVDMVIGGPPCKGFSLANKMTRDMSNPMNHLMYHFLEMVRRLKPAAFVMENVPGLLAIEGGKVVDLLIDDFKKLGYSNAEAWLLNAADYGVPQVRKRAFIVGSKGKIPISRPIKTHGVSTEIKDNQQLNPQIKLIEAIGDLPKIKTGMTLGTTNQYLTEPQNEFQEEMRKKSKLVENHVTTKNTDIVIKRIKSVPPGGNWANIPLKLMQVGGKYSEIEKAHSMIYKRLLKDEPCITITNFRKGMMIHPIQHRLLSVREAARIQTFPDDYVFCGGLSSQQQQVSDAVPVMLARKAAESVLLHMHQIIRMPVTSSYKIPKSRQFH